MGFSRWLAEDHEATGSRCRRRTRGPGIVQHLFTNIVKPARSKRDNQQAETHVNHLLFQLVDNNVGRGLFSGSSPRIGEEGNR